VLASCNESLNRTSNSRELKDAIKSTVNRLAALLCLLPLVTGCSSKDEGDTAKPAVSQDKQIEAIQNDTHMPQQAKDAAIGAIKSHDGGADAPKGDTNTK